MNPRHRPLNLQVVGQHDAAGLATNIGICTGTPPVAEKLRPDLAAQARGVENHALGNIPDAAVENYWLAAAREIVAGGCIGRREASPIAMIRLSPDNDVHGQLRLRCNQVVTNQFFGGFVRICFPAEAGLRIRRET